jgi:hypothetical protein
MPRDWSRPEVELIVADYLAMLEAELRGQAYSKATHRRALMARLDNRSEPSIEFKHGNISAVLIDHGLPYIAGYKRRANYQGMLADVVRERMAGASQLLSLVEVDTELVPELSLPTIDELLASFVNPPQADRNSRHVRDVREKGYPVSPPIAPVNYLQREALNRALGLAGEEFVVRLEQARLIRRGKERLAAAVDHVARTRGDGLGYDILSFDVEGREQLIEVKTTKYGKETPFFVSRNEVDVSAGEASRYHLFRVFAFRKSPKVFTLAGALSSTCDLQAENYRAWVA